MNLLTKSFLKIKKVQINGFSEPFYLKELSGSALADFRNRCLDTQGELSKLNDFENPGRKTRRAIEILERYLIKMLKTENYATDWR